MINKYKVQPAIFLGQIVYFCQWPDFNLVQTHNKPEPCLRDNNTNCTISLPNICCLQIYNKNYSLGCQVGPDGSIKPFRTRSKGGSTAFWPPPGSWPACRRAGDRCQTLTLRSWWRLPPTAIRGNIAPGHLGELHWLFPPANWIDNLHW